MSPIEVFADFLAKTSMGLPITKMTVQFAT